MQTGSNVLAMLLRNPAVSSYANPLYPPTQSRYPPTQSLMFYCSIALYPRTQFRCTLLLIFSTLIRYPATVLHTSIFHAALHYSPTQWTCAFSLWSYACATRCPVLTSAMVLRSALRHPTSAQGPSLSYGYLPTRALRNFWY
eukprot:2764389-Rhodomonas_salina.1